MSEHLITLALGIVSSLTATGLVSGWGHRKRITAAIASALTALRIRRRRPRAEPVPVIRLGARRTTSAILATAATFGGVGGAFSFLLLLSLSPVWIRMGTLTALQRGGLVLCTAMLMAACWLCWSAAEGAWRDATAKVR